MRVTAQVTDNQTASLARLAKLNSPLHHAYLLKEELRLVFKLPLEEAMKLLQHWLNWACRCRIRFIKLARTIREYVPWIETTLTHRLTNARVESLNTKLRLITRRAFGFQSAEALIALAMLALGCLCPPLPHMSGPPGLPTVVSGDPKIVPLLAICRVAQPLLGAAEGFRQLRTVSVPQVVEAGHQ